MGLGPFGLLGPAVGRVGAFAVPDPSRGRSAPAFRPRDPARQAEHRRLRRLRRSWDAFRPDRTCTLRGERQVNIGLALHTGFGTFESVKFVARTVFESLAVRHDVRQLPPAYDYSSPQEQERMARELVDGSDVLVGFYSVLEPLLAARHRSGRTVPCLVLVLGAFPRGALLLKRLLPYLTSSDFLVVNCAADAELARRFFAEPRVTVVPLAIDLDTYRPLPSGARGELRRRLKFDDASRVLVYAGRVTPEKGVHTTLRVFSAVNRLVPDSVLVVAGPVQNAPFAEVGVTPVNYGRTLALAAERLGLPAARVRFVGPIEPRHLHLLYTAADVAVNMTLDRKSVV